MTDARRLEQYVWHMLKISIADVAACMLNIVMQQQELVAMCLLYTAVTLSFLISRIHE